MANHLSGRDEAFNSSARSTQQADSTGNRDHPNQPVPRGNLRTLPLIATLEDTVTDDFYLDQNLIWQRRRPRTAEHQYNSVEASDPPHQEAVSPATSPPFAGSPHSLPPFTYLQLPPESLLPPGLVRRRIRSSLFDPTLPVARETTSPVARERIIPVAREMPYNNAAIPPPEEISGSASLPRKTFALDGDDHWS